MLYLAQWDRWVRMESFLGFFHQSSKSLVVAARRGHISATFRLGRPRVRTAVGLSCLANHLLTASRSRRSCSSFAPRRPAVKPGMTPVELAAPRVRRARSARRLDNQSNATLWSGAEAVGEHVTVALANHHPLLVSMTVVIVFS